MNSKIVYLQCAAGIAGDMALAALLAAGANPEYVKAAAEAVAGRQIDFSIIPCRESGISGLKLSLDLPHDHDHRSMKQIEAMIGHAAANGDISNRVADRALRVFRALADAEGSIHGVDSGNVEFHEIGALDSIVDIVGVAAALESLGIDIVAASPLPMTGGMVKTMHGLMPIPAPATLRVLKGWQIYGQDATGEFVTPTGAAICVALAGAASGWPQMNLASDGFGFGNLKWPDERPNCVRAAVGTIRETGADTDRGNAARSVFTIEANIDDSTPEQLARLSTGLMEAGALDAWICPVLMKKGRPGWVVSALCGHDDVERLSRVFFLESSTIGVRYRESDRITLPRTISPFQSSIGRINVKTAMLDGRVASRCPEPDDVARIAADAGIPVIRARRRIEAEIELADTTSANVPGNVPRP